MELKDLVGKHILQGIELGTEPADQGFWSVDSNFILFALDGVTYKATENPDDGYRSYLNDLEIVDKKPHIKIPDVEVVGIMREDDDSEKNDVIEFRDVNNGRCVLAIGTGNTYDYYPYCVLSYKSENMSCNDEVRNSEEA